MRSQWWRSKTGSPAFQDGGCFARERGAGFFRARAGGFFLAAGMLEGHFDAFARAPAVDRRFINPIYHRRCE